MRKRSESAVIGEWPYGGPRIFYDDCEGVLKWEIFQGGEQSRLQKSQSRVYEQEYSNEIRTGWSVVDDLFLTGVKTSLGTSKQSRLRIEVAWLLRDSWYNNTWSCLLGVVFKDWYGSVKLEYGFDNEKWFYTTSPGDKLECPNGSQSLLKDSWHKVRIDVDFENRIYLGGWSDNLDLGIKGKEIDWGEGSYAEKCEIWLFFYGGYKVFRWPFGWTYYPNYWHVDVVRVEEI